MIVYFSGTGNTEFCAKELSRLTGDTIFPLSSALLLNPDSGAINLPDNDSRLIWMFPVYSWGIPLQIQRIMERTPIICNQKDTIGLWMVCTCGDDIGRTANLWRRIMRRRGLTPLTAFSLQMPNTYVFMKGFDVDNQELAIKKIALTKSKLPTIAQAIESGKKTTDIITKGSFAAIKTGIIRPYFNKFCTSPKPFRHTDACVGCGKCARECPMNNITMHNGKPKWGNTCMLCSRCYHTCPTHAVAYGKTTLGKGQSRFFLNK